MSKFWNAGTALACAVMCMAALFLAGCKGEGSSYKPKAVGGRYELLTVIDETMWDGAVGDTIRSIFYKRFPMVNREETRFDVLRVFPSGLRKMTARYPNILMVDIDPTYTEPSLELRQDIYAKSQTVVTAKAPDASSMAGLLDTNRDDIMLLFEAAERDRDVADATAHTPEAIKNLIKEKFGFEMSMGPAYKVQKVQNESEDFLWLAYRSLIVDQGIIIYTYPFSGVEDFDKENLLKRRDEFVARIQGENPGSHMSTNPDILEVIYKRISGRQWAEMAGFWDVTGDFLGGPYRNYSTLDMVNQRVIAIDFYVLAPDPQSSQRNLIRQLEHYIHTVKIPSAADSIEE